jgi:hypothetical protein
LPKRIVMNETEREAVLQEMDTVDGDGQVSLVEFTRWFVRSDHAVARQLREVPQLVKAQSLSPPPPPRPLHVQQQPASDRAVQSQWIQRDVKCQVYPLQPTCLNCCTF